ncbi:MAG: DUF192 domain-containing protein [Flavobacteriaceae bacterium]
MNRFLITGILCLFIAIGCKDSEKSKTLKKVEISFTKQGELHLIKKDTDSIIQTLDIEIADDEYKTQTGLMYRDSMEDNQAMLFIFPDAQVRSFYMKNTAIALDIIYIDENKNIVSFQKNTKPYDATSLPSGVPSQYVLEVNAGLSDKWGLEKGDRIEWNKTM